MSKKYSDRVEKWGELLAELSQSQQELKEKQQRKLDYENEKLQNCYEDLEAMAYDFQPEELKKKLQTSLSTNKPSPQVVFSHVFRMTRKDNYRSFILKAFKTKAFTIKFIKNLLTNFFYFIAILNIPIGVLTGLGLLIFNIKILRWGMLWEWFILTFLMTFSILTGTFVILLLISYLWHWLTSENRKNFALWLEDENNAANPKYCDEIWISNHRQIKLPELRMLFLELEKFKLKPDLLILKQSDVVVKQSNTVVKFELRVTNNPEFMELLENQS